AALPRARISNHRAGRPQPRPGDHRRRLRLPDLPDTVVSELQLLPSALRGYRHLIPGSGDPRGPPGGPLRQGPRLSGRVCAPPRRRRPAAGSVTGGGGGDRGPGDPWRVLRGDRRRAHGAGERSAAAASARQRAGPGRDRDHRRPIRRVAGLRRAVDVARPQRIGRRLHRRDCSRSPAGRDRVAPHRTTSRPGQLLLTMRARGAAFPQRWVSAGRNRVSPAAVGLLGLLALGMAACGSSPAAGRSNAIAAVQPLPRSSAAMAYDPSSRAVVLYGGVDVARTASGHRHDTWLWSGSWKQYAGFSPELANPAMAYDGAHRQMILVGLTDPVFDDDEARFAQPVETWVWDGRGWRNPHPQPAPHATLDPPTLAYDTVAKEMILVEREPSIGESMWRWTGAGLAAL